MNTKTASVAGGLALLLGACSGNARFDDPDASRSTAAPSAPAPPTLAPELPDVSTDDRDGDRVDDALGARSEDLDTVSIEVILNCPTRQRHLNEFAKRGGQVRHVFAALSYGWTGRIAHNEVNALRDALGGDLRLIAGPKASVLFLDEATRTGRVRPVWAPGFAGLASGASGNPNITIAILDTGVDESHPDLNGRRIGWQDYSADGNLTPGDAGGHGTHVASIALGSGAAFGLGPGTLRYTNTGTLSTVGAGSFASGPIHTPSYFGGSSTLSVTSSAAWLGGATNFHQVVSPDPNGTWAAFSSGSGMSPQSETGSITNAAQRFSDALQQTSDESLTNFAVANTVANYPAVGDGFNALRGVAPSCKWFGAKVFSDSGLGLSADIGAALDDLVAKRAQYNIKVINMSLGVALGTVDSALRAKANNAVNAGIVVVAAAGNYGPSQAISDPGLANQVITVGASNDQNELTSYTSIGKAPSDATMDSKPDLLAPGGSQYRSLILAADSNTNDAASSSFPDRVSNDYTGKQGTSMASPFVAGAAALLIDALQQSGVSWSLSTNAQPLFVKMLMLASATETNVGREQGLGNSPTLGRADAPKDSFEGFGLLNPDAAVEAVTRSLSETWTGSVSNVAPARLEWERRAWGRKVSLASGTQLSLSLSVPSSADFDLYLYAGTGDANGDPVIRAFSTNAALDADESLTFTSATTETAYVFVKRVSGYGSFSLSASIAEPCNGPLDSSGACVPAAGAGGTSGAGGNGGAESGGSPATAGARNAGAGSSNAGDSGTSSRAGSDPRGDDGGAAGSDSFVNPDAGTTAASGATSTTTSDAGSVNGGTNDETSDAAGALAVAAGAASAGDAAATRGSGCGCTEAGRAPNHSLLAWLFVALGVSRARRRRTVGSCAPTASTRSGSRDCSQRRPLSPNHDTWCARSSGPSSRSSRRA